MNNAPAVILVEPQMGENIGAAARAMLNFGFMDLRIVNPRDGWPNQAAIDNGTGAFDKISAKVFDRFEDSIADLGYVYATTARPRDMVKPVTTPREAFNSPAPKTGFVFGRERTGLENDQVALCHAIIEIPTNPGFSSLNLAQAVLVIGYEWLLSQGQTANPKQHEPAPHGQSMELFERLESELEDRGFFRSEGLKPTMINNIRSALTRAQMTDQEVRTFHGIISALIGNKTK